MKAKGKNVKEYDLKIGVDFDTTLRIKIKTKEKLNLLGTVDDSYDTVIKKLIEMNDKTLDKTIEFISFLDKFSQENDENPLSQNKTMYLARKNDRISLSYLLFEEVIEKAKKIIQEKMKSN